MTTATTTTLSDGRGWLRSAAAASIARIDRALGHALQITEAGRTWAQQNAHWLEYLRDGWPIALHPDTPSIHQLGNAIDSDEAQEHVALMAEHGWVRTVYRNGKLVEPWHFEYDPSRDQHRNDPAPSGSNTTTKEEDMPITILERKNSKLTKSLYDVRTGKAIRALSKDENTALRAVPVAAGTVIYITVSDADYKAKGGK